MIYKGAAAIVQQLFSDKNKTSDSQDIVSGENNK